MDVCLINVFLCGIRTLELVILRVFLRVSKNGWGGWGDNKKANGTNEMAFRVARVRSETPKRIESIVGENLACTLDHRWAFRSTYLWHMPGRISLR